MTTSKINETTVPTKKTVAKKAPVDSIESLDEQIARLMKAKEDIIEADRQGATLKIKGKSPKEVATRIGEPYVAILSVELDPDDIGNGAFEIDWNDIFLAKLIKAGYQGKTDADVIDNWFKTICKNIVMEEYEQWEANQPLEDRPRVVERRDIGNGRVEVS